MGLVDYEFERCGNLSVVYLNISYDGTSEIYQPYMIYAEVTFATGLSRSK